MAKDEACSLKGAEAAAHGHRAIMRVGPGHQRQHLVEDVVLEGGVPADAVSRMTVAGVEGLARQTLDAIELQLPGIDLVGEPPDDVERLILPEAPVPRGEHEHLRPGMAEDQELHVPMQPRTVPAPVISPHVVLKNRLTFSERSACCAAMPG